MKAISPALPSVVTPIGPYTASIRRFQLLAIVSFVIGPLFGLLGLVLSLLSGLDVLANSFILGVVESALIVTTLLLLIAGAHSLDRIKDLRNEQTRDAENSAIV